MKAYKVLGTTDDVTTCELCGKQELKGTVALAPLDADGNPDGDACYFGVSCAAKAAGWTQREVRAGIKAAKDEERERERAERDAAWAAQREFLASWYLEHYGTRDLHEAAERAGLSTVQLSGEAIRAYRELERAAEIVATTAPADTADESPQVVETAAPATACPVLAEPGNMHFMGYCMECDAHRMVKMTPDTVEHWYHQGCFGQVAFDAYMYAWATSAIRYGTDARLWAEEPTDPEVIKFVAAIRRHAGISAPMVAAA